MSAGYALVRTEEEIDNLLNEVDDEVENGRNRFRALTAPEAIADTIRWLTDRTASHPYPKR